MADKEITPELLQEDASAERMAEELIPLIKQGSKRDKQLADLKAVCDSLGSEGSIARTGKFISEILR